MSLDPGRVDTITFDSFTTIVDVHGSTHAALSDHVEAVESIARLWRSRAVDYRMVSTFVGAYETYEQTTREALEYALDVHGVSLAEETIEEIAGVFYELDVFDDVYEGMRRLDDADYDLAILSNGNPALLDAMVDRAGVREFVGDPISAHEIRTYKPHPAIYELAAERTGTDIDRIAHAATPWYDVYGAFHAGMQAVWMNRRGRPWDAFDGEPDATVSGFDELVDVFA